MTGLIVWRKCRCRDAHDCYQRTRNARPYSYTPTLFIFADSNERDEISMFYSWLPFELEVFQWISGWASPFWDAFFVVITRMGNNAILFLALGLLLFLNKRTRKIGMCVLAAIGLVVLINNIALKSIFGRPRPFLLEYEWWVDGFAFPGLIPFPSGLAFPSGHSAGAFAAAGAWLLGACRWHDSRALRITAACSFVLAGLMAFSRMYLGVHYLSDIIVGSAVGIGCAFLAVLLLRLLEPLLDRFRFFRSSSCHMHIQNLK